MPATVTAIATTPVKGLRLRAREQVTLTERGVADDRRFFLVDAQRRLVNGKRVDTLTAVRAGYDAAGQRLTLCFPDGRELAEAVSDEAAPVQTWFFSQRPLATPVCPQLSAALSQFAGIELQLVRPAQTALDRGPEAAVSLLSRGSLERLAGVAGEAVDGRRFRMLLEVDGLAPHGEDEFVGRQVRIGQALVRFGGHVGRCRVTTLDPDTGAVTLSTLDLLSYRKGLDTTEPLAFGVYGAVLEPGVVRIGDAVALA